MAMTKITLTLLLGLSGATVSWATTPVPASAYASQAIGRIANIHITNGSAKSVQGGDTNCENLSIDTRRVAIFGSMPSKRPVQLPPESGPGRLPGRSATATAEPEKGRLSLDNATGWGVLQIHQTTYYLYCEACEGLMGADFTFPSVK